MSRTPPETFATTQTLLLVAAAIVLLWVALAVFLAPPRRALVKTFVLPMEAPPRARGWFRMARESEMHVVLRPLLVAAVLFVVATVAALLR